MSLPIGTLLLVASVLTSGTSSVMGEKKGPPLLELEWTMCHSNYPQAEELFAPQEPNITIRCKGEQKMKVRKETLFKLMKYFADQEEDEKFYNRTSHDLDLVDVDILKLVVRFVETGKVYLRQNEYARFGKAVEILEPFPTCDYKDELDFFYHRISIKLLGHTGLFRKLKIGTGDVKIMCENKPMYIHSIVAELYSGVLKRKIENAVPPEQHYICVHISVDDIKYKKLASIRRLIYGQPIIKYTDNLPCFLKLLKDYEISYTYISPDAVQLPSLTEEQIKYIIDGEHVSFHMLKKLKEKRRLKMGKKKQSSKQTVDSPPPPRKQLLEKTDGESLQEDQRTSVEGAVRTHETPENIRKSASFPEQQESTSSTSGVQEVEPSDLEPFNTAPGPSIRSRERLPETEVSRIGESQPESDDYDSDTYSVFTDESVLSSE